MEGLEGIKVSRVACGSSHSVAWTTPEWPTPSALEPIPFPAVKDPLGTTATGMFLREHLILYVQANSY